MAHPDIRKIITEDGSASLYSNSYNQSYHNPNGALTESKHVFFEPEPISQLFAGVSGVSVFETGFGTGLNLILLLDKAFQLGIPLQYMAVEAALISPEVLMDAGYDEYITHKDLVSDIAALLGQPNSGMNTINLGRNIEVSIFCGYFDDCELPHHQFNLFFHDAFSPDVNGELWTLDTFKKLRQAATSEAILTTYCAASAARAAMAAAGWYVAKAPGALGKREMTLAATQTSALDRYKRINEKRLTQRLMNGDFD